MSEANPTPETEPTEIEPVDPKGLWGMTDKVYDTIKWIAQYLLPAFATLYIALGAIWPGLPEPQAVAGTVIAVDTFLGVIMGISTSQYNKSK